MHNARKAHGLSLCRVFIVCAERRLCACRTLGLARPCAHIHTTIHTQSLNTFIAQATWHSKGNFKSCILYSRLLAYRLGGSCHHSKSLSNKGELKRRPIRPIEEKMLGTYYSKLLVQIALPFVAHDNNAAPVSGRIRVRRGAPGFATSNFGTCVC